MKIKNRAKISALACSEAPGGHAQWSLRLLADQQVYLEFLKRNLYFFNTFFLFLP
jgi:hypothetical protein